MKRAVFKPGDELAGLSGAVLCRDLTLIANGRRVSLRRGTPLGEALERLPPNGTELTLHILVPDPGDIIQEEASERLARGIAGEGIQPTEPHQGQVDLRATAFGVLRVDGRRIARLNGDGLALIATGLDGRVVEPDEVVAIVKAAELLAPESGVARLLAEAGEEPLVRVKPFIRRRVALVAGTRIREANLKVSSKHLASGLERFGAELAGVARASDDPGEIAALYRSLRDDGAELILVAGSIVLDPEDPFLAALDGADARLVRRGAPIDPGTMFWVAYAGDVPMFGLASCEMYGRLSIFDLFLPYALAGEPITDELISTLGYGGLLNHTQSARRPGSWRNTNETD
jgi:hypothetical protein